MNKIDPAKISVCCFIFLVVLYLTGAIDYGLAALLISLIAVLRLPAVYLFLWALLSFILYLLLIFLSLRPEIVGDLSVSSYFLFAAGLVLYFLQGQKDQWNIRFPLFSHFIIRKSQLLKSGGILVFILLIYPLAGAYLALIFGYIALLIIFHKFSDGRYAFGIALFFLVLCPFLLLAKKDKIAETSAIFTYYFLVIGTLQEIIEIVRKPRVDAPIEEEELPHTKYTELKFFQINRQRPFFVPRLHLSKIHLFGFCTFLLIVAVYFFLPKALPRSLIHSLKTKLKLPQINLIGGKQIRPIASTVVPTVSMVVEPLVKSSPTLTLKDLRDKVASDIPRLNLSVENGTTISGLAASTAARLKEAGFKNILFIGNAPKQDYKNWEIEIKSKKEILAEYVKKLLDLSLAEIRESSSSAKYDMVIITGERE